MKKDASASELIEAALSRGDNFRVMAVRAGATGRSVIDEDRTAGLAYACLGALFDIAGELADANALLLAARIAERGDGGF
jgi:hypothetical protein